jgi:hypothetical protein
MKDNPKSCDSATLLGFKLPITRANWDGVAGGGDVCIRGKIRAFPSVFSRCVKVEELPSELIIKTTRAQTLTSGRNYRAYLEQPAGRKAHDFLCTFARLFRQQIYREDELKRGKSLPIARMS